MKKFFIFGVVAAVLSFAVALGAKSYRTTHNTLFYANLDALANPEGDNGGGGGSDPGSGGTNPGGGETNPGGGEYDPDLVGWGLSVCICTHVEPINGYYDFADMKNHCHRGYSKPCVGDVFACPYTWYCDL